MFDQYDLDKVAKALFSVRTSEKPEYERLLIRAGKRAVKPLLRAVIFVTVRQKDKTENLARSGQRSVFGESETRYMWAKITLEPIIDEAVKIIQKLGSSGTHELCATLLDADHKIRLATALILCKGNFVNGEILEATQDAIYHIGPDKKQGATVMLLGIMMVNNGDHKWRDVLEDFARKEGVSFERCVEKTINTGLIELQKYK